MEKLNLSKTYKKAFRMKKIAMDSPSEILAPKDENFAKKTLKMRKAVTINFEKLVDEKVFLHKITASNSAKPSIPNSNISFKKLAERKSKLIDLKNREDINAMLLSILSAQ